MAKNSKKHKKSVMDSLEELGFEVKRIKPKMVKIPEIELNLLKAQNEKLKIQNKSFYQALKANKQAHSRCHCDILDALSMSVYNLFGGQNAR